MIGMMPLELSCAQTGPANAKAIIGKTVLFMMFFRQV